MSEPLQPDDVPAPVVELAENCRQYVLQATGVELDHTSDTLPLVDHYLVTARDAVAERPEILPLTARALGAYFGEVMRGGLDAFWRLPDDDIENGLICCRRAFMAFCPVGIAHELLAQSTQHSGSDGALRLAPEDRVIVAARLDLLPELEPRDYYTFSTRYDSLEISEAALRAAALEGGQSDVRFEYEDYDEYFEEVAQNQ